MSDVPALVKNGADYVRDLCERVVFTFLEGFVGGVVVTQMTDKSMWLAAVAGGAAAVTSLFKGLVARGVGQKNSASLSSGV